MYLLLLQFNTMVVLNVQYWKIMDQCSWVYQERFWYKMLISWPCAITCCTAISWSRLWSTSNCCLYWHGFRAMRSLCATMANGCPICRSHIDNAVVCDDWWSVKCCQQIFSIKYINNTKHQTPFVVALADTEMQCDTNYMVPYMLLDSIIYNLKCNSANWMYFQMSLDPDLAVKTFDKLSDMEKTFRPHYKKWVMIADTATDLCKFYKMWPLKWKTIICYMHEMLLERNFL